MSIRLRIKYQYRSFLQFLTYWRMPAFVDSQRVRVMVSALVVLVGAAYVFEVNAVSTSGYAVEQLETKLASLQISNQELTTQLASAESLTALKNRLPELRMVAPTRVVRVVAPVAGTVAER